MLKQQKEIRLLRVLFNPSIKQEDLIAFRGAVAEKVGLENDWFHNHNNRSGAPSRYFYRYPLIQYKRINRCPAILFVGSGVDEAQYFFAPSDWSVTFGAENKRAVVADMQVFKHVFGLSSEKQRYKLRRWLAFNQKNYEAYLTEHRLADRILLLEKALAGHILALATGIDFQFEQRFSVDITSLLGMKTISLSRNKMIAFDVEFETDAVLLPMVGLGRGVSRGMGELTFK